MVHLVYRGHIVTSLLHRLLHDRYLSLQYLFVSILCARKFRMILFVFFIDARNIVRLLYLAIFYMTFEMRTIYGINLLYSTAGQCENDADKTNMMDKM